MANFTQLLDGAHTFTSNLAAVLRNLVDKIEAGEHIATDRLRPLAEQADAFGKSTDNPVPTPPTGGVPVDQVLTDDQAAAVVSS